MCDLADDDGAAEDPEEAEPAADLATVGASEPVAMLEPFRPELTGYCYRMLGSAFEAEDAAQETMVRAGRDPDGFDDRAPLRLRLYRIGTHVCLDMLQGRPRRAWPMDLRPVASVDSGPGAALPGHLWIEPIPDNRVLPLDADAAVRALSRETIRLAFVAALQHVPPRQRAALILCEALGWRTVDIAALLDTTVASVDRSLQEARAALRASRLVTAPDVASTDDDQRALSARYMDAFERFDIDALMTLLREDVTLSMPPFAFWLRGRADLEQWFRTTGAACRGSLLVPTMANGGPAFGLYRDTGPGGTYEPFGIQVIEESAGRIQAIHTFLEVSLFPLFALTPISVDGSRG